LEETFMGEARILRMDAQQNFHPMTPWYSEKFLIRDNPAAKLLSGARMRDYLYFATAPGNHDLFISSSKNGVVRQLPAI
jgi:hypothetical protein